MADNWKQWWGGKSAPFKATSVGLTTTASAALMIAIPFITGLEGESLKAYRDVAGVWTICNGETAGVKPGDIYTPEECQRLSRGRIGQFMTAVDALIQPEVAPATLAAATSFAYNIGTGGFKLSQTLRLLNEGDLGSACRAMMNWNGLSVSQPVAGAKLKAKRGSKFFYDCNEPANYAKVNGCKGIVARRTQEVKLCLEGGVMNVQ